MYTDYILLAIGGVFFGVALLLLLWLLLSRKRSRRYRQLLAEETQKVDMVETLRSTEGITAPGTTVTGARPTAVGSTLSAAPGAQSRGSVPPTVDVTGGAGTLPVWTGAGAGTVLVNAGAGNGTVFLPGNIPAPPVGGDLDTSVVEERYELLSEMGGGGMSRVFLARNRQLGNEWVVKYVEGEDQELMNEADVLKRLNHISLPQVIDVFRTNRGIFLVERYIEGYSLKQALTKREDIREGLICDWGLQLSQVLHYLHTLDNPIIHCDMKPANIMVTHDNRLVLIDFGISISKSTGGNGQPMGITVRYAAPEQFKGRLAASEEARGRFGVLPPEQQNWAIGPWTDLYSVGVILYELCTGGVPFEGDTSELDGQVTPRLAEVIRKCLALDPKDRWQSAEELASAMEGLRGRQAQMARSLVMRRVAAVVCAVLLAGGAAATASGAYVNRMENLSVVDLDPGQVMVTRQQSVQLLLRKTAPDGTVTHLEPARLRWTCSDDSVARLDGDRLVGVNVGEATFEAQYRGGAYSLTVTVTEPAQELTEVALRYPGETKVEVFAGSGERDFVDGTRTGCSFVSPESMWGTDGQLYVTDSGTLRLLEEDSVTTLPLEPLYYTASLVRGWDGALYVSTGPWQEEDGSNRYGLLRIRDGVTELLMEDDAVYSVLPDFAFASDGVMWFIKENVAAGATALYTMDGNTGEVAEVMDLPDGASNLAFDGADNLYISVPDSGIIVRVDRGAETWSYFIGQEGDRHFIDGSAPKFYNPVSLAVEGDFLYVLDFDTVRRVTLTGENPGFTETLAGMPVADTNPPVELGLGQDTVLAASGLATLCTDDSGRLLLSDPKNSVIYQITAS